MATLGQITRRTLLAGAALAGAGLAIGYYFYRKPYANPLEEGLAEHEQTFNPYVKIAADNTITVIVPRAEMGQGVTTTLAALVAEELDVGLDSIKVEHGPAAYAYYNSEMLAEGGPFPFFNEGVVAESMRTVMGAAGKLLGLQGTGGSTSTRDGFDRMRQAGAAARHMLLAAAAAKLSVPAEELETANGRVVHKVSGRSVTYGEVAADAVRIEAPSAVRLKERSEWRLLGQSQMRTDMRAKVTGAPIFGVDVSLPEMLYGTVRMSPRFWAKPMRDDLSKAQNMPGVVKIVRLDTDSGSGFGPCLERWDGASE